MEEWHLGIYLMEVERQCKFLLLATDEIERGLKGNEYNHTWYAIQNFLVAAGNISKLLWPPKGGLKKRGEEIRTRLGIKDESVLNDRSLRNHFEHFDERLDKWVALSKKHEYVDGFIHKASAVDEIDAIDRQRNFDRTDWIVTFRGDRYELRPIIAAANELYLKSLDTRRV
jgi:hypothetical protein